jgi:tetratricopeptide (TPR) repeat protein
VPSAELDLALEIVLGEALFSTGRGDDALERAGSLVERALALDDRVGELFGKIQEGIFRVHLEPEGAAEKLAALAEQALPVFEAAHDDLALYIAYLALARVAHIRAQMDTQLEALERAVAHARRAGLPYELLLGWRGVARLFGTSPVSELLAWLDEQMEQGAWNQQFRGLRAQPLAMLGHFEEARAILVDVRAELADRGGGVPLGVRTGLASVDIELLAGDFAAAVEFGEEGCRLLGELGAQSFLSTAAAKLAQALYALDRLEEAETWAGRAAELGASDDAMTQMLWRQVKAKVLARHGEHAEAERMAREAVAVGEETDILDAQGDALADLAEVFLLAGKPGEAAASLEQAIERHERKGNRVSTGRAQTQLAAIQHPARR